MNDIRTTQDVDSKKRRLALLEAAQIADEHGSLCPSCYTAEEIANQIRRRANEESYMDLPCQWISDLDELR